MKQTHRGACRRIPVSLWILCALVAGWGPVAGRGAATIEGVERGDVVVIPIHGMIAEPQFYFVRRTLKLAERAGASGVLLEIDTPGGEVESVRRIAGALTKTGLRVVSYVRRDAFSGGALVALATDAIYMAPVSAIGAAAPILMTGDDLPETMNEKQVSALVGFFKSVAERKGHNPGVAEAFIDMDKELKVGGEIISPSGKLLTLSAQEATRVIAGRALLAAGIAGSTEEAARAAGLTGELRRMQPTGFERLAGFLTMLGPLFMLVGLVLGYIEFKTPGFGLAGIGSAICFLIFFTGHYLAGLAGLELLVVFFFGFALVLVEVMFFPGTILLALTGVALMFLSLLGAMIDRYPSQPMVPSFDDVWGPLATLTATFALSFLVMLIVAKFMPVTPGLRRFVLSHVIDSGAPPDLRAGSVADWAGLALGEVGLSESMLRPSGKARFGGRLIDVIAEGAFVAPDRPVRIIGFEGVRVVVEEDRARGAAA